MESRYAMQRTAFLNAISQFDLSTLSDSLQLEINNLCQAFNAEVNENTINLLDNVLEKCLPLKDLYEKERQTLKITTQEIEHSKGFSPSNDNSKSEKLSADNSNLPSKKNMPNSKKRRQDPPPTGQPIISEPGFNSIPRRGFPVRNDSPTSRDLGPGNSNPPTKK